MILDLPAGGYNNHWTRNIVAGPDGQETLRLPSARPATSGEYGMAEEDAPGGILELDPDGTGERSSRAGCATRTASTWSPRTGAMWTAVNERDGLGDELVPDYITSVRDGGLLRLALLLLRPARGPAAQGRAAGPGRQGASCPTTRWAHTCRTGAHVLRRRPFPERYRGGAFVGQRGSWNRSEFSGYDVVFVPFDGRPPERAAEDFLTGFIARRGKEAKCTADPVGLALLADGSLLVADDAGNTVWRVRAKGR